MTTRPELEVGDLIAVGQIRTVPCCYCEETGCCELVERRPIAGWIEERVRCNAQGRTFRRIWVCW